MEFNVYLSTLRQKGNLAYEYNPLHNYQTDVDLYLVDKKYIVPAEQAVNIKNGELLIHKFTSTNNYWVDKRGNEIDKNDVKTAKSGDLWAKAGSLIDFDTDKLNFDLDHPVEIEVQPSYDGSVNLILNDDKNIPRLINSRFSVREKNTYEIVDRIGENDTNIYNSKTFDKDTSLYFQYKYNPLINYLGFVRGQLEVGQYCFYFTYCDADDNESDFIAESGLIPVFIGNDKDPLSMDGGIKNQQSHKGIKLKLTNLDKSYNFLKVYYVRYFADYQQNRVYECKKIYQKYPINSSVLYLQITGFEEAESLDPNILNITRFNPKSILTQAQCKNMLFFGNIVQNSDNYKELTDLALRIVPELNVVNNFSTIDEDYLSSSGDYAYYNSSNIYNKTGYFNKEYYRFGVVFIYQNGTLSRVYNTLGGELNDVKNEESINLTGELYSKVGETALLKRNYIKVDDFGWIKESNNEYTPTGNYLNARGVCQLNYNGTYTDKDILSIRFRVPEEVSKMLRKDLGIRGLFFVRQKCIPNIIAQCYLLSMDETLEAPVLETGKTGNKDYYTECFINKERRISNGYSQRLYKYQHKSGIDNAISNVAYAGICPDFLLNQPYYNQIFNGGKFRLEEVGESSLSQNGRFYNEQKNITYRDTNNTKRVIINSVTEDVPTVAIKNKIYRLEIGETEEAFRFKYAEVDNGNYDAGNEDTDKINEATNLVRGKYSPYLAIYSEQGTLKTGCLYNIRYDLSISTNQEYQNRMDSSEPFYAISDRHNISEDMLEYVCWRGDCYINQFTYRLVRNFNDPSLPNNDEIIDPKTWENYDVANQEKWADISRSDINAVQLGSWITFKVRSAMNYALRSVDHSYVSEEALMGSPRSFYPRSQLLFRGENKMPDSYLYNDAYRASLGFKCYFALQNINYIKDTFSNRIQYSAISIQDSFKNNYRYSLSTYYRDYSQEYGSIQKLIGFEGYLLVVFEHAIGIAVINERVLAGSSDGEPVFINTKNVLPEELTIISDTYGTQWGDSVIKSEAGYVYGVDTEAKKIWRVKGQQIEILSDFKVNKFLIDNITLSERELFPTVGLRNVKTHYNNNKKDIMFTFYDDVYKDEEKVWNLCYNELLDQFITFYSWIPSYSANIDTKFFSFDRNTAKELSLLAKCNYSIPENSGVLVDNPMFKYINDAPTLHYVSKERTCIVNYTVLNPDHTTSMKSISVDCDDNNELKDVSFRIEKDHWQNYKLFNINNNNRLVPKSTARLATEFNRQKVIVLYITPYISNTSDIISDTTAVTQFHTEMIALTLQSIVENPLLTKGDKSRAGLTTDFYLHGQAGIFNVVENLYPTYWYGQFHPFEFEFVVNDKIGQQKIFENLVMISNKAEPESFHFEIEGDNYEFSSDKRNMYFRQEATKNLYQNLGSDILYNRYYTDVAASKYTYEDYHRPLTQGEQILKGRQFRPIYEDYPIHYHEGLVQQVKSTIFPLYYERVDTYNDIYHKYHLMHDSDGVFDFENLSGSEISWNRDLNQFNIITHIKNSPIDRVGRLRGNSRYKEGKWHIQIPPIAFNQQNEERWPVAGEYEPYKILKEEGPFREVDGDRIPPIVINSQYVPKDIDKPKLDIKDIPNIYTGRLQYMDDYIDYNISPAKYVNVVHGNGKWTARKEARIRDKWIKIRIRYSGKNLAIIHSLITLYNVSYS